MTDADFIICGAGPAGATAARFLSQKGHSVLFLDKDDFPRDKACGGGLCPHILEFDYLKENLDDYLESICTRGMIFSPSMTKSIDHVSETPLFYNIRRKAFDHKLVQFAQEEGAELKKAHVKKVQQDSNGVSVVTTNGEELSAKAMIGASGPYDPVAKQIRIRHGLSESWADNEIGTIVVNEFDVDKGFIEDVYGEEQTSIIHLQTAGLLDGDYGYGWIFSKNSVLNIGYGGFKRDMSRIDIRETFVKYIDRLKQDGFVPEDMKVEKYRGAPLPLAGAVKKSYHDRMLIAGDAAGFVSPISGEGIYYAMDSGRIAADVLHKALGANDFSSDYLARYQKVWNNAWGRDLWILRIFANRLMAWPEALVRYGMKDIVFRKLLVDIFISSQSAYKLKMKVAYRVIRNFLMMH